MNKYKKILQFYARLFVKEALKDLKSQKFREVMYLSFDREKIDEDMLSQFPDIDPELLLVIDSESTQKIDLTKNNCIIFFNDIDHPFILPLNAIIRFILPKEGIDLSFDPLLDDAYVSGHMEGKILNFPKKNDLL